MAALTGVTEEIDLRERIGRIETLVGELERLPDPGARAAAEEVVAGVLDLHGAALARVLDLVTRGGGGGGEVLERLCADPLVASVLLLHGLHPVGLRERVEQALESVRPYMRGHGGGVALLGIDGDAVRIRLEGTCDGCPSSATTLRLAVERAIVEAAPDVGEILVEEGGRDGLAATLRPLPMAGAVAPAASRDRAALRCIGEAEAAVPAGG